MASGASRGRTPPHVSEASPSRLEAQYIDRNNRFSFVAETPLELHGRSFRHPYPTNMYSDKSPTSLIGQQPMQQLQDSSKAQNPQHSYKDEKKDTGRLGLPHHLISASQPHPAMFAPYAEPESQEQQQHHIHRPPPLPQLDTLQSQTAPPRTVQRPTPNLQVPIPPAKKYHDRNYTPITPTYPAPSHVPPLSPTTPRTPTYNPHSLGGPNVSDPENHKPGQVAHPNAAVQPHWHSSLCSPSSTCCLGLAFPCVVYGRTQHRLTQRSKKYDPTDMLGHSVANSACVLMAALACFGVVLAAIQRGRVRRLYGIEGAVGDDCLRGCCCCCCVLAQDEREVESREERIRKYAGPASAYVSPEGMKYPVLPR